VHQGEPEPFESPGARAFRRFAAVASDERRFERGLQILLDGIELELERRRARR
jgi:hypothetical protein